MKRLATLFILTILVTTAGFAKPKHKDLSGNIAIKGELTKEYQQSPAGTPVIIRRVVKMNNPGENSDNIYYAVEVNGIQEPFLRMRWVSLPYPLRKRTGNSGSKYT